MENIQDQSPLGSELQSVFLQANIATHCQCNQLQL
jgi:hypothetical protein